MAPETASHAATPPDDTSHEVAPPSPAQLALTVAQVAAMLGMSAKAVYHRAERGQLPGKFYVGRSLRFRRSDLLRFITEGRGLSPTGSR